MGREFRALQILLVSFILSWAFCEYMIVSGQYWIAPTTQQILLIIVLAGPFIAALISLLFPCKKGF